MNKKGEGAFLGIVLAVVFFIFGTMFIPLAEDLVTNNRSLFLCATPSLISDGTKLLCLINDAAVPYFILAILSICFGMILGGKIKR
jgi:hypothetical protein